MADYIPDATPLAEALSLFETREWYLTLRGNQVSGLITYWEFNSRQFCVQLYTALSRIEELSRNILASDSCGVLREQGLKLDKNTLKKAARRFRQQSQELGGNRFVDALDFGPINEALKNHGPWRQYLEGKANSFSEDEYQSHFDFKDLRNAVMHGRAPFPTYNLFKEGVITTREITQYIDHLEAYLD